MPILQYCCKNCRLNFEELVKQYTQPVRCPKCGEIAERSYCGEIYSATGKTARKCSGNCRTCGGCK